MPPPAGRPELEVRSVTRVFWPGTPDETTALAGVSARFESGGLHLVWGPSGSGKSTLLSLMGGLDDPSSGQVLFDGSVLASMSEPELALYRRHRVGFVFQRPQLFSWMPIWANVTVGLIPEGYTSSARREIAAVWLRRFDLESKIDRPPELLSGGDVQRACLARAVVADPDVILADEPTAWLDAATAERVVGELEVRAAAGKIVILTTHDPDVRGRARWVTTLDSGRLVDLGGSRP
jgi:putative ABC transport system ATP-binding protein